MGDSCFYLPGHFRFRLGCVGRDEFLWDDGILPQAGQCRCQQQSLHALYEPGEKLKEGRVVVVIDVLDVPES